MRNAASSATEGLQKDINELISKFDLWQIFADFHKKEVSNGEADQLDKFERWKAERKKVIRDLADFMYDPYGGVHDTVLDKIPLEDHKHPFSACFFECPAGASRQPFRIFLLQGVSEPIHRDRFRAR